jgi:predicted ester cyclase
MTLFSAPRFLRRTLLAAAATTVTLGTLPLASAQAVLNHAQARALIAPFYDMLNQPATKDLKAIAEAIIAPEWRSVGGPGDAKGREAFVGQVGGFGKLIPDLTWRIQDVLVDGDRIIVRGEASGTPVGPFFGVPVSGKSFRIMSIDIHTVKDGKLVEAHHVEDWASAMRQLRAN